MPTLLDTGFNVFAPLEVAADMDARHLRRRFGREALLWGNIGRQALMDGPQAIDEAIAALEPLIAEGGFLPVVDDMILPDISYASFMHYAERIKGYRF
jgi:uroporphyrinogen decarboxylase